MKFILISSIEENSHEGFGIVYLEANACGTPVLAAKLAGAVEAVDVGKSRTTEIFSFQIFSHGFKEYF